MGSNVVAEEGNSATNTLRFRIIIATLIFSSLQSVLVVQAQFSIDPEGLTLKRFRLVFIFAFATILLTASNGLTTNAVGPQEGHGKEHGFSVRQYEQFHHVLHPLQHDALPKKDFRRIRAKSALLTKRGKAIVNLGVPRGTSDENRKEFTKELKKFNGALAKFRANARRGTDAQLEASYSAVHDSFEMLVAMLPRG